MGKPEEGLGNTMNAKAHGTSEMPPRDQCVFPAMLDAQAQRYESKPLILFEHEQQWTYREAACQSRAAAAALQHFGIQRGEPVLVWLPSTSAIVRIHFGLCYLGGIFVPINLALKGGVLEHVIVSSGATTIICHAALAPRLETVALGSLQRIVIVGGPATGPLDLAYFDDNVLAGDAASFTEPEPPIQPWEPHGIFYTSGTTGRSKGVIASHLHTAMLGRCCFRFFEEHDRFLMNLPYFHMGGVVVPFGMLAYGASMALLKEFRTQTFWDEVNRTQATSCFLLGAISTFLMKQPARANDAQSSLRSAIQQPVTADSQALSKRFAIDLYTQLDMTEMAAYILSSALTPNQMRNGYCGRETRVWPSFEARLVDEHDCDVLPGEVGELIVRCDMPHVISPGYWNMPEATAHAWRNGWFHTGDALRKDSAGDYFFVDRLKDCIRRRGENISSAEVEEQLLSYSAVGDAAAVATKSEHGEDEVLAVVVPKPGQVIVATELFEYLVPLMPHFMLPRYIRILGEMPYTQTHKIQKAKLRSVGISTSDVWDRETAGYTVKRDVIK